MLRVGDSSVMLMADAHCQPFKVGRAADCLVAGHVGGTFPALAAHEAGRASPVRVAEQTERSARLSPAPAVALAGGGGGTGSQVTAGSEKHQKKGRGQRQRRTLSRETRFIVSFLEKQSCPSPTFPPL